MAAPTQEYPPWLSPLVTVLTDPAGVPTATATTILNLPLTYYGPSIPLGTDGAWVYGGLSSPPPQTASPTSTLPSSPSATPSLSTITSLTTATPSPSSLSSFASSSLSNSLSSTASTSSTTTNSNTPTPSPRTDRARVLGLSLGITGSFLLLFLFLGFFICFRRRRSRRTGRPGSDALWQWHQVEREDGDERMLGEGSPRGSGEEHDPFLQPLTSVYGADEHKRGGAAPTARLVDASSSPFTDNASSYFTGGNVLGLIHERNRSPVATHDPHGIISEKPLGFASSSASSPGGLGGLRETRHILSHDALNRMYSDTHLPRGAMSPRSPHTTRSTPAMRDPPPPEDETSNYDIPSPLLPPPRLVSPMRSNTSMHTHGSEVEGATVHMARRVRLDERGRRPPAGVAYSNIQPAAAAGDNEADADPLDEESPLNARWARAVGLASFTNLGRNSWIARMLGRTTPSPTDDDPTNPAPPRTPYASRSFSRSRPASTSYAGRPMTPIAHGAETSHLSPPPPRLRELGFLGGSRSRPLSAASGGGSGGSGGSAYYDAYSHPPTPVPGATFSTTSTGAGGAGGTGAGGTGASGRRPSPLRMQGGAADDDDNDKGEPPTYDEADPFLSAREVQVQIHEWPQRDPVDALDAPVPRPVSPFAASASASSTAQSRSFLRATTTTTTHLPPGLPPPRTIQDAPGGGGGGGGGGEGARTSLVASSTTTSGSGSGSAGITIDVLDELPPPPGETWNNVLQQSSSSPSSTPASSASNRTNTNHQRRRTFGGPAGTGTAYNALPSSEEDEEERQDELGLLSAMHGFGGGGSGPGSTYTSRAGSSSQGSRSGSGSREPSGSTSSHGHRQQGRQQLRELLEEEGQEVSAASPTLSAFGHRVFGRGGASRGS